MIGIKTAAEIKIIKEGGRKLALIREDLLSKIKAGTSLLEIDNLARKLIRDAGGKPSFMTVNDYRWATCISVNEGVVHGVPNKKKFAVDDLVSLDIGLIFEGWHTDTSWTTVVKNPNSKAQIPKEIDIFLETGKKALKKAIMQAKPGNRVGNISKIIQEIIEGAGYSIVKTLVGHGIGKTLHEEPQIPGFLEGDIRNTPLLKPGMVIAIEVIYAKGKGAISYANDDGWTLVTKDRSLAGLFEDTVWISEKGPVVITRQN